MPGFRHNGSRLRSWLLFAPLYGVATVGYGLVSMAWSRFDPRGVRQHRTAQAWARMLLRIARVKVTVEGLENLSLDPLLEMPGRGSRAPGPAQLAAQEKRDGGAAATGPRQSMVLVCNHLSYMDVPVLFASLPLQFRILAKAGLFRIPFLGGHLTRAQHLPVDQSNVRASMRSLQQAAAAVREGLPLFIFPEAGRSFSGEMQEFVPGAFYIAIQAQVPIVPMVLIGTYEILPPTTAHLRPGRVTLAIAPPIPTTALTRHDAPALAATVRNQMLATYRELHSEAAVLSSR